MWLPGQSILKEKKFPNKTLELFLKIFMLCVNLIYCSRKENKSFSFLSLLKIIFHNFNKFKTNKLFIG